MTRTEAEEIHKKDYISNKYFSNNRYKIIYGSGRGKKIFNLKSFLYLSYMICVDCELFECSEEDIYVGNFTKKSLVYIGIDLISYFRDNYFKNIEHSFLLPGIDHALSIAKKWVEDDSVQDEFVEHIYNNLHKQRLKITRASNDLMKIEEIYAATCSLLGIILGLIESLYGVCSCIVAGIRNYNVTTEVIVEENERIRQGRVIMEFLNSSKHLFMV